MTEDNGATSTTGRTPRRGPLQRSRERRSTANSQVVIAEGAAAGANAVSRDARPPVDQVAAFRPAILAIRAGTTAVSTVLASGAFTTGDSAVMLWCVIVVGYNLFRIAVPLRYTEDVPSQIRVIVEVSLHVAAVFATDYWDSPFVFSLLTAVIVAGFARGFAYGVRIGAVSALAVAIPDLSRSNYDLADLRTSVQWSVELLLVGLVSGYARRITGEADRQHSLALDRLGRLADANALLFSLHQVAQTLPASLDLDEVLDSTMARIKDLFQFSAASLLLVDETVGGWQVVRWEGHKLPGHLIDDELAPPLHAVINRRGVVREDNLIRSGGPGLVPSMRSGIYAVLTARDSLVGIITIEHDDAFHFTEREVELLTGFAEPAALAVDNARWFGRLRTVGADEERTRIARDLHDRIGQSLAYLAFELDRIVKADGKGDRVTTSLEHLRKDVRGVVGEVRDTLYDLRTDVSDVADLPSVITGFLERVHDRSGLATSVEVIGSGRLPLLQEREMWRVAQEAVTNVERHAQATSVVIRWKCDGQGAELEVSDDGRGFQRGQAGRLDSYGLLGMRERAASIGAVLVIDTAPGKGASIRCVLRPVPPPAAKRAGAPARAVQARAG
jgi:signal transduction histidine kinase